MADRVGDVGDSGKIEISDMLFTVKGPTAGAILMEWNVHEDSQGSGKFVLIPQVHYQFSIHSLCPLSRFPFVY